MQALPPAEEILRRSGLRVTAPRKAVLDVLRSSGEHPTADLVEQAVNRRYPRVSRASVYNVLRSLKRAGLVAELVLDDAVARYDVNLGPHHHFVCRKCRCVEDVPSEALVPLPPPSLPGRVVEGASVVLRGLCAACASAPRG